ncbi:MAG: hypothetical protein EPO24_13560 [Bacteroidetes bacterium]|nr:MAG: hypothetical protein EPO24_13560 [Bacteroidota bacterium]
MTSEFLYNNVDTLQHSRSLLKHLIYAMENDRSLHAERSDITMLKSELLEIEGKMSGFTQLNGAASLKTESKV